MYQTQEKHKVNVLLVDKLSVFVALLKKVPLGSKRIQDSHIKTICAFFVLLLSNCMEIESWKKKKLFFFNFFMSRMNGLSPSQFQKVQLNDIPIVEDLLFLIIFL